MQNTTSRIDRRYSRQRIKIARLKQENLRLEISITNENRKASALQRKLDSILHTSVDISRIPPEHATLCIQVEMKTARDSRSGAIWKIAIDQLISELQQKVRL